jgi:hypothetical protein
MTMLRSYVAALAPIAVMIGSPAFADTYTKANFSAGIFGGNANVSSPFSTNGFFQGQTFTGSFVSDNQLVPAGGTGFVNVFASSYPDVANISAADLFTFNFGSLTFTATDPQLFAVQYNNGAFNGFFYQNDFAFQGGNYRLGIQGGSLSVYALANGNITGSSLVNGYVNIGNSSVTGATPFTPTVVTAPVPEPATWMMMIAGFGLTGAAMRRRTVRVTFAR